MMDISFPYFLQQPHIFKLNTSSERRKSTGKLAPPLCTDGKGVYAIVTEQDGCPIWVARIYIAIVLLISTDELSFRD